MTQQDAIIPNEAKALFFAAPMEELEIVIEGQTFVFSIKGLSQYEVESISSTCTSEATFDPESGVPSARINHGEFYQKIIMAGVVRAPFPWTEENVQRLTGSVRDQLLAKIKELSDGLGQFKKK